MPDHSHYSTQNTGYCEHCGQPLPAAALTYGTPRVNRVGLAVTVLLHFLLVAVYLFKPQAEKTSAPPAGGAMVYINPVAEKTKPQQPSQPKKQATKAVKKQSAPPPKIERLPDTITLPDEKPVKIAEEAPKKLEPPEEVDMAAYIAKRRQERGAPTDEPAAEESEAARGARNALANIAAANGRSKGDDRNDTGGVFSVTDKSFSSAKLKFRGWNPNFKRRWLQQVNVELDGEKDIETAIVKKMIELIRKEKPGDFDWDSQRLQRVVRMSARVQDTAELEAFLFKEMFPEYRAGR